jgi:hypothetical protein
VSDWHIQNPNVLATRATRKTTRFGVRDAKCNAAGAMHRVAWALQTAKGTGQKCEKPWKNPGFTAERTGTEQPAKSLGKSKFKNEAAQNPTRAAKYVLRWQRARQRTSKTNVLTNDPIYRVTTLSPFQIYRVTDSRLQGHL